MSEDLGTIDAMTMGDRVMIVRDYPDGPVLIVGLTLANAALLLDRMTLAVRAASEFAAATSLTEIVA